MLRKKVGLALSGGGARGYAHIGILKVFAEYNIPIDMIAGTSAGSLVGGALASGMSPSEIERMAKKIRWRHVTRPSFSPRSLLSNVPIGRLIERNFPVQRFEDLRIPFSAVACDLATEQCVVFKDSGDVVPAIRASCAVPAIFSPVRVADGRLLVDGGLIAPVPIDAAREMGADIVIAVDLLSSGATFRRPARTAFGMLFNSALTLLRVVSKNQTKEADLTIVPKIGHIRPDRLNQTEECMRLGEEAARESIDQIRQLINGSRPEQ